MNISSGVPRLAHPCHYVVVSEFLTPGPPDALAMLLPMLLQVPMLQLDPENPVGSVSSELSVGPEDP